MNKKTILSLVAIMSISFIGFISYSFASVNKDKNRPPVIVGIVSEINGTNIVMIGRDKNTYTVDASNATVVSGFLGFWAKPSSFSNIQVTDTLTVKGKIQDYSIFATEIADNKTQKRNQPPRVNINSTKKILPIQTEPVQNSPLPTSTSQLVISTTTDAIATTTEITTATTTDMTPSSATTITTMIDIASSTPTTTEVTPIEDVITTPTTVDPVVEDVTPPTTDQ